MPYLKCLDGITDFVETRKILEGKNLIVKLYKDLNLFLVKYNKEKCNMSDPDVLKSRGLILEKDTNKLVCVPPLKSVLVNKLDNYDIGELSFEEFPDGTMINVFRYNNSLHISTRSNIGASCKWYSSKSFKVLFNESISEEELNKLNNIDEGLSLSFVLQHPENIIVTKYKNPSLILVHGCRVTADGVGFMNIVETSAYLRTIGLEFRIPEIFKIESISEVYEKIEKMSQNEQGIVIKYARDSVYIRSKVRNEYYNYVKDLKGNSNNKKFIYMNLRKSYCLDEYLKYYPEDADVFETYRVELYEMTNNLYNFYQDCFVRTTATGDKKIKFQEIDFEYKPLCSELHQQYKNDKLKTDKRKVINYISNLPSARILFVINYKKNNYKNYGNTAKTVAFYGISFIVKLIVPTLLRSPLLINGSSGFSFLHKSIIFCKLSLIFMYFSFILIFLLNLNFFIIFCKSACPPGITSLTTNTSDLASCSIVIPMEW